MESASATTTPVEVARRDLDALARRDSAGMADCYSDDAVVDFVALREVHGSAGVKEFFDGFFAAVPDLESSYEIVAASDDTVVVEWRQRGTFNGSPFEGIEPTGKRVDMRGVDVMKIAGDKIVHNTAYYDGMDFARQIGMMPPQDSGAEKAMMAAFNATTKLRQRFSNRA